MKIRPETPDQIAQSMREDINKMRSECQETGIDQDILLDSKEAEDMSAVVREYETRLGDFGTNYESTYGRWVERQVRIVILTARDCKNLNLNSASRAVSRSRKASGRRP